MNSLPRPQAPAVSTLGRADALALAVLALPALWLLWGPLVSANALYFRDLQVFFIPLRQFLADSLARGELPFWNPGVSLGSPYFAEMQTGVLYPPSWLLLISDGNRGIALLLLFHLLLAAGGAYALARRLGLLPSAALATAGVFAFGGCLLSTLNMINFLQALAWLPWVLWAFEADRQAPAPRRWALASAMVGLQTLAGAPDVSIMTGLVLGAHYLARTRSLRWLPRVAGAYLLALLLASPQLLATFELFRQSVRTAGLSLAEIEHYSLRFDGLWSLLLPPPLSRQDWNIPTTYPGGYVPLFLSLYLGWIAAACALFALWARRGPALFWLGLGGAGVFLALGGNNPVALWIYQAISIFRYPEKYVVLLHVGLAIVVGLGLDAALRRAAGRPVLRRALLGVPLLMLLELAWVNGEINLQGPPDYYQLDDIPELRWLTGGQAGFLYTRTGEGALPTDVREIYAGYRRVLSPHIGTLAGVRYVEGTEGLTTRDHARISEMLDGLPPNAQLLRRLAFLNVRYVMSDVPVFQRSRWLKAAARHPTSLLWDLGQPRPLLYFPAAVLARGADFIDQAVADDAILLGRRAFAETPDGQDVAGLRGRVLTAERSSPQRMTAKVRVAGRALLVWNESFYPGWRVTVDGEVRRPVRANHFFLGVWLEDGEHTVRFAFVPNGFYPGLVLTALAVCLLLLIAWRGFDPRRWRPSVRN